MWIRSSESDGTIYKIKLLWFDGTLRREDDLACFELCQRARPNIRKMLMLDFED